MKKHKLSLIIMIISSLFLLSCKGGDKKSCCKSTEKAVEITDSDPEHTAENSLSWGGIYKGTIHCASCDGIETELTLNYDNTYVYSTKYLGKDKKPHKIEGTISWTNGSIIQLNNKDQTIFFLVGENYVELRNSEGNEIISENNYRLDKLDQED